MNRLALNNCIVSVKRMAYVEHNEKLDLLIMHVTYRSHVAYVSLPFRTRYFSVNSRNPL
jgi:hypothetical protein